ncbi:MAG: J domain-containing protein [Deltaproteobacteria bacterium]|nr:J domain-containing protein [Deltaproteobacteria bacterium]
MAEPDYYAVLGVDATANADDIKKAFRRLTLEFHPDRHAGDPLAEDRYRQINAAYDTLSDPALRAKYDAQRRFGQLDLSKGFDGQSARDLLGNVFGDVFGNRRAQRRKGRDLRYTLSVDLAEAVLGTTQAIGFEAPGVCTTCSGSGTKAGGRPAQTCPNCGGRGEVKGEGLFARRTRCGRCDGTGMVQIDPCSDCRGSGSRRQARAFDVKLPPGTAAGTERVLTGLGEPGRFGGEPGDLRTTVNVRPHPRLVRDGDDLRCDATISIAEAALGTRLSVPTVDGDAWLEVPAGIKSGTKLRLRGKGVPTAAGGKSSRRGDQLVLVTVETPAVPSGAAGERVRAALAALEEACNDTGALPRRSAERATPTRERS